jgi:hypothetical protein
VIRARLQAAPTLVDRSVPLSGPAELIRAQLRERRQDLADHNAEVVDVTAVGLAALHEAAHRHVPSIRCDRQVRYRRMQLQGKRGLQFEDLVAIGLETPVGEAAAVAALRVLAGRFGYTLTPATTETVEERVHESHAQLIERTAALSANLTRALADGELQPAEATVLGPHVHRLKEVLAELDIAVQNSAGGRG